MTYAKLCIKYTQSTTNIDHFSPYPTRQPDCTLCTTLLQKNSVQESVVDCGVWKGAEAVECEVQGIE